MLPHLHGTAYYLQIPSGNIHLYLFNLSHCVPAFTRGLWTSSVGDIRANTHKQSDRTLKTWCLIVWLELINVWRTHRERVGVLTMFQFQMTHRLENIWEVEGKANLHTKQMIYIDNWTQKVSVVAGCNASPTWLVSCLLHDGPVCHHIQGAVRNCLCPDTGCHHFTFYRCSFDY